MDDIVSAHIARPFSILQKKKIIYEDMIMDVVS